MRRLISIMNISSDGFIAKQGGDLDWLKEDEELFKTIESIIEGVDILLFGRVTFQIVRRLRQNPLKQPINTVHYIKLLHWFNSSLKYVVSGTLNEVNWKNTSIINADVRERIVELKEQEGGNILLIGSPGLAKALTSWEMIDDFRLFIHPVLLTKGVHFVKQLERSNLKFQNAIKLNSGVIDLLYSLRNDISEETVRKARTA